MKFRSVESRDYPTLAMTLAADAVVELPDDTNVAGLVPDTSKSKASAPAPVEVVNDGSAPQ